MYSCADLKVMNEALWWQELSEDYAAVVFPKDAIWATLWILDLESKEWVHSEEVELGIGEVAVFFGQKTSQEKWLEVAQRWITREEESEQV